MERIHPEAISPHPSHNLVSIFKSVLAHCLHVLRARTTQNTTGKILKPKLQLIITITACKHLQNEHLSIRISLHHLSVQVSNAEAYESVLAREGITLAVADRTEAIWRDVCAAAAKVRWSG